MGRKGGKEKVYCYRKKKIILTRKRTNIQILFVSPASSIVLELKL